MEYTANFNLDKYSAGDRPNLRDQYNSAMDKIDAILKELSDSMPSDSAAYVEQRKAAATVALDVESLGGALYCDPVSGLLFYKP